MGGYYTIASTATTSQPQLPDVGPRRRHAERPEARRRRPRPRRDAARPVPQRPVRGRLVQHGQQRRQQGHRRATPAATAVVRCDNGPTHHQRLHRLRQRADLPARIRDESDPGLSANIIDPRPRRCAPLAKQKAPTTPPRRRQRRALPTRAGRWCSSRTATAATRPGHVVNGTTKQGIFIINNGTLKVYGNRTWWGVIYPVNAQGCGTVTTGLHQLRAATRTTSPTSRAPRPCTAAIFVDGRAASDRLRQQRHCLPNLMYDPSVIPNSRRTAPPGSSRTPGARSGRLMLPSRPIAACR